MKLALKTVAAVLVAGSLVVSAVAVMSPSATAQSTAPGSSSIDTTRKLINETAATLALLETPVAGVQVEDATFAEMAAMAVKPLGLGLVISKDVDILAQMGKFDIPTGAMTHRAFISHIASESDCRWTVSGKSVYIFDSDSSGTAMQVTASMDVMDILTSLGQREAALRKSVDPEYLESVRNRVPVEESSRRDGDAKKNLSIVDEAVDRLYDFVSDSIPEVCSHGTGSIFIGADGLLVAKMRAENHVLLESIIASIRASLKLTK